jgi:hypothetical protein
MLVVLTCDPLLSLRVTVLPVLPVPPRVVAPPVRPVVPRVTWVLPVLLGVLVERVIVPVVLTELERSLTERFT